MILIPIFMPQPKIGTYVRSSAEQEKIAAKREVILSTLDKNNGLTLQEIAVKTKQDIRTTEAILTVLKRYGKIESVYTEQGKLWRIV